MTVVKVKCSPGHARELAVRAEAAGAYEIAAALKVLADDFEQLREALAHARAFVFVEARPFAPTGKPPNRNAERVLGKVDAALERTRP